MYQSYIGLEIHIQLLTRSKVFCGCKASFGDEPNTNICPVCMGYPGILPALNEEAIRMAYLTALALNCEISRNTVFDRKNYYYPDLPKNYQISQFGAPVGKNGYMDIEFHRRRKRIRINEVHLEEDAGKMIHAGEVSLLDFNRTGTPLLEIVTAPDLEIGEEAEVFIQNFRKMVRYLGVCDGNMEEGSLRCDANVSVNLRGRGLGQKVEIKNLNSSKFVRKALNFEIERQEEILERGGTVRQETRQWNENRDLTEAMRIKESAQDYRYFPEPDLPPFTPDEEFLHSVSSLMVELPLSRKKRFMEEYKLTDGQADFICEERSRADFFEQTIALGADPHQTATWMSSDVKRHLNRLGTEVNESPLTPVRLAKILKLLKEKKIHVKIAKQVVEKVFTEDLDPEEIIRRNGWEQITDRNELGRIIERVLRSYNHVMEQVHRGDSKPVGFLMGQIMKATSGRAEPQLTQKILWEKLSLRVVNILSMGGAISATFEDGVIVPGRLGNVKDLFPDRKSFNGKRIRLEALELANNLSEEITPEDWALLLATINEKLKSTDSAGIVITHGTDTLPYTASLVYWFFSDTEIPIVLTASSTVPGKSPEAEENLKNAISSTLTGEPGVYVILGDRSYSPVNLKFQHVGTGGFTNWNMEKPLYRGPSIVPGDFDFNRETLKAGLEDGINRSFIARVFPGMKADYLIALINAGVKFFILELYDTGTANLRETPYSIKNTLLYGRERGVKFFCTSQQEGIVDFSEYITSHELWKEGAIPMGGLTTESAYTKLLVSVMVSETEEEAVRLMESTYESISI